MKSEWNKLDNAAKIFPAAQSKKIRRYSDFPANYTKQ